jgi:hypothetical protein
MTNRPETRHAGIEIEVTPEMIEAGVEIFDDWLAEQDTGFEAAHSRELIHRVLLQAKRDIQKAQNADR